MSIPRAALTFFLLAVSSPGWSQSPAPQPAAPTAQPPVPPTAGGTVITTAPLPVPVPATPAPVPAAPPPATTSAGMTAPATAPIPAPAPPPLIPPKLSPQEQPRTLPAGVKVVYNQCIVDAPVVALTFDDGPHDVFTPRLLDTLKARNIKATFFMVGQNANEHPHIVKRIAEEGHEVANHSWSHPSLSGMSQPSVDSQLKRTHDAILAGCGVAPVVYRPPYGNIRLTQRKHIMDTLGYPTIIWDVDPQDWQPPRTVKKVYDRVLAQTKPGSIILCHDIHEATVDAMPATIDALLAKGFQFVTVTQLINYEDQCARIATATGTAVAQATTVAPALAANGSGMATPPPPTMVAPALSPNGKGPALPPLPPPPPSVAAGQTPAKRRGGLPGILGPPITPEPVTRRTTPNTPMPAFKGPPPKIIDIPIGGLDGPK